MPSAFYPIACLLTLFFSADAFARTVDWTTELAADLLLAAMAYGIESDRPESAKFDEEEFPTQGSDDYASKLVRGEPSGDNPTKKERLYREASNLTVFSAGALPVLLSIGTGRDNFRANAMTVTHTLLLSNVIVTAIKYSVRRPRPKARHNASLAEGDNVLSFPSGHSSAAFAGATLVSLFFPEKSWWIKTGAYSLAVFTAWARIAGDKHFLVDVTAGGLIGAGSAVLTVTLLEQDNDDQLSLVLDSESVGLKYRF